MNKYISIAISGIVSLALSQAAMAQVIVPTEGLDAPPPQAMRPPAPQGQPLQGYPPPGYYAAPPPQGYVQQQPYPPQGYAAPPPQGYPQQRFPQKPLPPGTLVPAPPGSYPAEAFPGQAQQQRRSGPPPGALIGGGVIAGAGAEAAFEDENTTRWEQRYYMGGGLGYLHYAAEDSANNISVSKGMYVITLYGGTFIHENIAIEAGTNNTFDIRYSDEIRAAQVNRFEDDVSDLNTDYSDIYLDLVGFLRLADNLQLIGSFGGSYILEKVDIEQARFISNRENLMYRFGLGAEYGFNRGINIRAAGHLLTPGFFDANEEILHLDLSFNVKF